MGMTLVEKVIAAHCGRESVSSGETVSVAVDRVFYYGGGNEVVLEEIGGGGGAPFDPGRIVIALDQFAGESPSERDPAVAVSVRRLALLWGVRHFFDVGRGGVPAVLFADSGLVRPGDLVAAADDHALAFGALGAVALVPRGGAFAKVLGEGRVEVRVPSTVRVLLEGEPARWTGGRDMGLKLLSLLPAGRIHGKALEISGPAAAGLGMTDRFSLAACLAAAGASQVFVEPDDKTLLFSRARSAASFSLPASDADASFEAVIPVDLSRLSPQLLSCGLPGEAGLVVGAAGEPGGAAPFGAVRDLREARGEKVDCVLVGGCSHGMLEGIRAVARFLREYMVSPSVTLVVIPGSQKILLHAMEEGLIQIIIRAGGHIGPPSCRYGENLRGAAVLAGGHCLSTGCCPPHAGRVRTSLAGAGRVSYANPSIAAVAAIMGTIQTPLDLAKTVKRMATGVAR